MKAGDRAGVGADPGETDPKKVKDEEECQAILDYQWFKKISEKSKGGDESVFNNQDWAPDIGDDNANGNLGAARPHWSDLQAHYYAATGHRRQGCYTTVHRAIQAIRDEKLLPKLIEGEGKIRRKWHTQTVAGLADKGLNPDTARPYNVFDCVMLAPVWSMDFDQQQAVVNAFHHALSNLYGPKGTLLETPITEPLVPLRIGFEDGVRRAACSPDDRSRGRRLRIRRQTRPADPLNRAVRARRARCRCGRWDRRTRGVKRRCQCPFAPYRPNMPFCYDRTSPLSWNGDGPRNRPGPRHDRRRREVHVLVKQEPRPRDPLDRPLR